MNTREYAIEIRKVADFLDSRQAFELPSYMQGQTLISYWDKEPFVNAAKALGDAAKEYTVYNDLHLTSKHAKVILSIARDKVCKKTVTYDCEALFSPEEVEAL